MNIFGMKSANPWKEQKEFSFKIDTKSITDEGEFEGMASIYGNVDLQNEVVTKGAFNRTLNHKNNQVTLLWQHDPHQPIGIGVVEDSPTGLKIKGQLNLEVAKAKEAYALLKQGTIKGLSIGYDTIKDDWQKGIRYLKELKLWEVSVVTFPANPVAGVQTVKNFDGEKAAQSFNTAFAAIELRDLRWKMSDALWCSINATMEDELLDYESKIAIIDASMDQYKIAFMEWVTKTISSTPKVTNAEEVIAKGTEPDETKSGRKISKDRMSKLKSALEAMISASSGIDALLKEIEGPDDSTKSDSSDLENSEGLGDFSQIMNEMKNFKV